MPTDDPIFDGFTITGQPRAVFTSSGATGRHAGPPPPQRLDDLRRAREGHGALGGRAAREHRDPHQWIPASWCSTSYRVTIPAILPSRRTSAAGVSRDSSVVSRSTGRSASTTG